MDAAELSDLLGLLRANGVTRYKSGDLEVELGAAPRGPTVEPDFPVVSRAEQERQDALAEERLLFAGVPGGAPSDDPEPKADGEAN